MNTAFNMNYSGLININNNGSVSKPPHPNSLKQYVLPLQSLDEASKSHNINKYMHNNEDSRTNSIREKKKYSKIFNTKIVLNIDGKPPYSYCTLLGYAINYSKDRRMTLNEIYEWFSSNYKFFERNKSGWKNSVRHNLSLNRCFRKIQRPINEPGKGSYWTLNYDIIPNGRIGRNSIQEQSGANVHAVRTTITNDAPRRFSEPVHDSINNHHLINMNYIYDSNINNNNFNSCNFQNSCINTPVLVTLNEEHNQQLLPTNNNNETYTHYLQQQQPSPPNYSFENLLDFNHNNCLDYAKDWSS